MAPSSRQAILMFCPVLVQQSGQLCSCDCRQSKGGYLFTTAATNQRSSLACLQILERILICRESSYNCSQVMVS